MCNVPAAKRTIASGALSFNCSPFSLAIIYDSAQKAELNPTHTIGIYKQWLHVNRETRDFLSVCTSIDRPHFDSKEDMPASLVSPADTAVALDAVGRR